MFTKAEELGARVAAEAAVTAALVVAYAHSLRTYMDSISEQVNDRIATAAAAAIVIVNDNEQKEETHIQANIKSNQCRCLCCRWWPLNQLINIIKINHIHIFQSMIPSMAHAHFRRRPQM